MDILSQKRRLVFLFFIVFVLMIGVRVATRFYYMNLETNHLRAQVKFDESWDSRLIEMHRYPIDTSNAKAIDR